MFLTQSSDTLTEIHALARRNDFHQNPEFHPIHPSSVGHMCITSSHHHHSINPYLSTIKKKRGDTRRTGLSDYIFCKEQKSEVRERERDEYIYNISVDNAHLGEGRNERRGEE